MTFVALLAGLRPHELANFFKFPSDVLYILPNQIEYWQNFFHTTVYIYTYIYLLYIYSDENKIAFLISNLFDQKLSICKFLSDESCCCCLLLLTNLFINIYIDFGFVEQRLFQMQMLLVIFSNIYV